MKQSSFVGLFKPRWINILVTLLILCMPILREQYDNGQYVTWYRPMVVFVDYLREPKGFQPLLLMLVFSLIVYVIVCVAVAFVFKLLKKKNNYSPPRCVKFSNTEKKRIERKSAEK
jgi:hypothetical protein